MSTTSGPGSMEEGAFRWLLEAERSDGSAPATR
jgi:hypothetical protein